MASGFEAYLQTLSPAQPQAATPLSFDAWAAQNGGMAKHGVNQQQGGIGGNTGDGDQVDIGLGKSKKAYQKYVDSLTKKSIPQQISSGYDEAQGIGAAATSATGSMVRQAYEDAFRQRAAGVVGARRETGNRLTAEGNATGLSSDVVRRMLTEGDADTINNLGAASAESSFQSGMTLAELLRGGATEQIGLRQSELQALLDYESARMGAAATRSAGNASALGSLGGGLLSLGGAALISDRRLKRDIELVGRSPSGVPIYEFAYVEAVGEPGRFRGVMAQDVEHVPGATRKLCGLSLVDYSKLDVEFRRVA